jgi:hypothetical protein
VRRRSDAGWEAQLAKLKAYKRSHGDCNVPARWAEDPGLGTWVSKQRTFKRALGRGDPSEGMTSARAAKLDALGFAWQLSASAISEQLREGKRDDTGWEAQLAKLKVYERRHGDCNVPQRWAEDPLLGRWAMRQRACKKAMDRGDPSHGMAAVRAAKLEALGFVWELPAVGASRRRSDAAWEAQLAKLKVYKRRHGDCNVPARWAEDPQLGNWVTRQRTFKRGLGRSDPNEGMMVARASKLDALGFAWQLSAAAISEQLRDDVAWEAQLAKLKAYKRRHGDCNVPQRWTEDKPLGSWVSLQRAYKRKLDGGQLHVCHGMTAARAAKLDALGFAWQMSASAISRQHSEGQQDDAGWEAQLAKLKVSERRHGNCNVRRSWAEDPPLGRWVDRQRARKKAMDRGEPSQGMTVARAAKLEALDFVWELSQK